MMHRIVLVLVVSLLAACAEKTTVEQGTTLYTNGVIWTGVAGGPDANALAVADGKIRFIGDLSQLGFKAENSVDLGGKFVMPGFIDNHVHFIDGGAGLASVQLRDATTREAFIHRIGEYANKLPKGRWVLKGNWDHEHWGGELPHRNWIDEVTGDVPVFVFRIDGHMALANSAALKLAGIDRHSVVPEGGEIVRDKNGEPTGVLKDTALRAVQRVVPVPSDDEAIASFEAAQDHAFSLGLTQVHHMSVDAFDKDANSLVLAEKAGVVQIRVNAHVPIESWQTAQKGLAASSEGRLKWGAVKGLFDGALGSATAWFHEPFVDDPDNRGFPLQPPEKFEAMMRSADDAGLRMALHAIGDRAIDTLLASMQAIGGNDIRSRRFRLEHFQHPTEAAIKKAAELGVIASMQPYHAIDDGRWAEKRIGPERIKTTYAFRSILDAGGVLTFGSDWPVAPLSPLLGVYAAVTRQTLDGAHPDGWVPAEKITVEEALRAYTLNNAFAVFEEDIAGTLEIGKRADFVVLSDDPRAIEPGAIRDIQVMQTIVDGQVVFSAN